MPALTTAAALAHALCLAATAHIEARGQGDRAQQLVISTILNNSHNHHHPTPCDTAQDANKYSANRPQHFSGTALVSGKPPSHYTQTIGIPKNDVSAYLRSIRLATYAVEYPQAFASPYHYFNNVELGKRYKTPVKAKRVGKLLFY